MQPKVFIITLNWDGKYHTEECLNSLQKLNYDNYEIVVVDNGSKDGSQVYLKNKFSGVHFIFNEKNEGFAEGNNAGMRYAMEHNADYVFIINNDAVVDSDVLKELVKIASQDAKIAAVGTKIYNYYYRDVIEWAGGNIIAWKSKINSIGYGEKDMGQYDIPKQITFISGCAMLFSVKALQNIGLFDSDFFAYCEDQDWCYRSALAGYSLWYAPKAKVWHKVSASTGGYKNPSATYLFTKNRIKFVLKNLSRGEKNRFWIYFFGYYAPLYSIYTLFGLRLKLFVAFWRGILGYLFPRLRHHNFDAPYLNPPSLGEYFKHYRQLCLYKSYIILSFAISKLQPLIVFDNQNVKTIIFVELTHLGDLIMSAPLLHNLKQAYPDAQIKILTGEWNVPLLKNNKNICEVITYNSPLFAPSKKSYSFFKRYVTLKNIFRQKPDLVVDVRGDFLTRFFFLFCRVNYVEWWSEYIFKRKFEKKNMHMVDAKLSVLDALKAPVLSHSLFLGVDTSCTDIAKQWIRDNGILETNNLIVVAPGSRWYWRSWPKEKFVKLIDKLNGELNAKIFLIGAPSEKSLIEYITSNCKDKVFTTSNADLQISLAFIKLSKLFIGNDSGPMHMAVALGTPIIALFGPQNPDFTGPYTKDNAVILKKQVSCSPCSQTICRNQRDWCMDKISVDDVFEAAKNCLRSESENERR